ncbi:MAG: ATP-binding protein [Pirellulaceae bacterium]|nr:ATP-binding protein [Pirellulaceae bacterium]
MKLDTAPKPAPTLPDWYPAWTKELAELYYSGTINTFVLHGNVHDLVRGQRNGGPGYVSLGDFLATQVFGAWDVALGYDLGRGLRALAGDDRARLQAIMQYLSGIIGGPAGWSRDPDKALDLVEGILNRNLLEDNLAERKRIALIFEHAQFLLPAGDLQAQARSQAARLVRFLGWAANPYIKRLNMAFCLITEKLSELSERLVNSPNVAAIEIPLPTAAERRDFISAAVGDGAATKLAGMTVEGVAQNAAGLSLVNLNVLLAQGGNQGLALGPFRKLKKTMIERQCQGLVEFVEPPHTLDLLVGQPAAKARLEEDANWISQGKLEMAPMGYLLCGAVGTGKTFFAECYAGSIGIPCLKLRNFRSKYVGETEGNLEQVLTVLRSLGPVVVIVDEADASLGDRRADGDSGTSGRVFSMIAQQMGDTRYRGRIIWMLLTCRPDLLPIDLKRQGRCEVHIPLFAPAEAGEITVMLQAMAKKNKVKLAEGALPEVSPERGLSGADLESVLLGARRKALAAGRELVERADLDAALDEFIPSAQGLEKELQELAAVLECTERSFLPTAWRERVAQPGARAQLQERMVAIRQLIESS